MSDTASQAKAATGSLPFQTAEEWQDFYQKFGANGRTFRDFTQLTPESMEAIYMIAYNQYNGGKYEDAERIFQLLSFLDHFDERYWLGLGAARERLKKYEDAIKAFTFLNVLNLDNPQPALLIAKCHMAQGKAEDAQGALHACVFMSGDKPEYAELKQQAQNLLELLGAAHPTSAAA